MGEKDLRRKGRALFWGGVLLNVLGILLMAHGAMMAAWSDREGWTGSLGLLAWMMGMLIWGLEGRQRRRSS